MTPSTTAPENGSKSQYCRSTGTTSVWLSRISGGFEPSPGERRHHVHPLGAVLALVGRVVERDVVDAFAPEDAGEPVACRLLAPRRVRRIDPDEVREELRRLFGDRVPVDVDVGHAGPLLIG